MRIVEWCVPQRESSTTWSGAVVRPPQTIYIQAVAAKNTGVPTPTADPAVRGA